MLGRFCRHIFTFCTLHSHPAFRQRDVRVYWRLLPYPFLTIVKCEGSWFGQSEPANCAVPPTLSSRCPDPVPSPCQPQPCCSPEKAFKIDEVTDNVEGSTTANDSSMKTSEATAKLGMNYKPKSSIKLPEPETFASIFGIHAASESNPFEPEELTHKFLLKQACSVNVDSVTRVITETISALGDYHFMYQDMLRKLINSLEESRGASERQQELITCRMIVLRSQMDDMRTNIADIESYLSSVERLAYATAETAYLAHAEYASIALSERIQSALAEAGRISLSTKELEHDLIQLQTIVIVESGNSLK